MSDFDTQLRARLERLEQAAPVIPWSETATGSSAVRMRSRRPRRRVVVLLAAAALVVFAGAAAAERIIYPDVPEPRLEAAIQAIWAARDCVPPVEARPTVQRQLDELGYADWTVDVQPGANEASCAAAAVLASLHEVRLIPGISMDIERAKDVIVDGLLAECMDRAEAIQFVTSVLATAGSDPFVVRAEPWGPQGGPIDKMDEYRAHVDAGCFVYVGMPTRDGEGRAVHELWGPWL